MDNQDVTLNDIKIDLMDLYIQASGEVKNFKDYVLLVEETINKFFQIRNMMFLVYQNGYLKALDSSFGDKYYTTGVPWTDFEHAFYGQKICNLPLEYVNSSPFSSYDRMMVIERADAEPFGVILFESTEKWRTFEESSEINKLRLLLSKLFNVIYDSIEIRSNETHYRKLYNMTDIFHSTMDTDIILENVMLAMEDIFPEFQVELILSNDQDRHTNFNIKQFDYLSERPSTIEAFVSGEMSVEFANDLNKKLINAPIKGRQAIYGILQVQAPLDFLFTNAQKHYIRMLAQASGNALENAKLYHQSHRLIADLQLINETSHRLNSKMTIDEMLQYLQKQLVKSFQPSELCFVFKEEAYRLTNTATDLFLHEDGTIYREYVEGQLEKSNDPLFIADFSRLIENDVLYKSLMAIPMMVENKINGYCIVLHEDPYFFSFDSFKLMQSLIQHSSLALSNSILRNRLQEMVDRDHLTKLYARRYLDRYVENSLNTDETGMFLLIDIDNFKRINDTYGHKVGDEILVQIAEQLQMMIGTRGICARWGGEELAVYIPNLLADESLKVAGEIVSVIPLSTDPSVTISAGLVSWKKGEEPKFQEIFLQADKALYAAKNNGKNQFCLFEPTMNFQS